MSNEGENAAPKRLRNIAELAELAGVSPGTVSRALAGKSLVNVKTRERIQQLAREHGFRLNQMASKLRTRQTRVIGIVIPLGHERRQPLSDPFFMTMLGHLADGLSDAGYDLMLSRVIPEQDDWLDRIVNSGMVDGVLLIGQSDQYDVIEEVAEHYRPLVVWGVHREGQRHCAIGSDNHAGGRIAAERLIGLGRRRLLYLGDIGPPEFAERYRGAAEVAAAAGLGPLRHLTVPLIAEDVVPAITAHLDELGAEIDGIIAASDVIAMNAIRALADARIDVPERIAVIGYDDLPIATHMVPRLTTVRQDLKAGAQAMIDALFARMRGEEGEWRALTPELVVRDSG